MSAQLNAAAPEHAVRIRSPACRLPCIASVVMIHCMRFERITIVGVGLIGGSLGLACRQAFDGIHITGYGHQSPDLELAIERGVIHNASTDLIDSVCAADLVIFATPVSAFGPLLKVAAPAMKPGAIISDVGSTKRSITQLAAEMLPSSIKFVGSHPMVGGEKQGVQHARADLLAGALCIITPTGSSDASAVNLIEGFWQMLNMRTMRMTPEQHDALTAANSHLPHAVAAALVRCQSEDSLKIAARGFLDTTRVAGGDPALWRDIFLDNRDHLKAGIEHLQVELDQLLEKLEAGDADQCNGMVGQGGTGSTRIPLNRGSRDVSNRKFSCL